MEADLDRFLGPGTADSLDLEALETYARRQALAAVARLVAGRLNADPGDRRGPSLPCGCGATARYAGRRRKTIETVLGPLTLEHAYYHCAACEHGRFPRDEALGLAGTHLSPALQRMVATACALASFADGAALLDELAGVQVPTKPVERKAEDIWCAVARAESAFSPEDEATAPAPTVYLGIDGTGVPMRRSETQGRAGQQPDGSARTREAKFVSAWTAQQRDAHGRPVRDPGAISYSARIASAARLDTDREPSAFERRLLRAARRGGFPAAARRVILGDGARWIWRVAREHFPGAIEIGDLFHAKERLWDLSKTLYRGDAERVEAWAEARCSELDDGSMHALLQHLGEHAADCDEARQCRGYFRRHRERMRYPEFRAQGLCVGSGVVEAGCKTVVGTRLKRPGMHWTLDGANAILALRSCYLSGRFEDFRADFRAEQPVASQA